MIYMASALSIVIGVIVVVFLVLIYRALALVPPPQVFLPTPIPVPRPGDDDLETCLTCYCLIAVKNWDEHGEYHHANDLWDQQIALPPHE